MLEKYFLFEGLKICRYPAVEGEEVLKDKKMKVLGKMKEWLKVSRV